MIDDTQYSALLDQVQSMMSGAKSSDLAFSCLFVAMLSELRTTRELVYELQKQFDQVSASGNALATERVS